MISLKNLLDMIATEALEGGPTEHCFDERHRGEIGAMYTREHGNSHSQMKYRLRIVRNAEGELDWAED